MSRSDKSVLMLEEIIQTAKMIGPDKTRQAIIDARSNAKYIDKSVGEQIKKHVAKAFKISVDKLVDGTSKGNRTDALMVGYVLSKNLLQYRLREIATLFKKDKSNISKSITAFNRLNPTKKQDKDLLDIYANISSSINEFINKNQWQENLAQK